MLMLLVVTYVLTKKKYTTKFTIHLNKSVEGCPRKTQDQEKLEGGMRKCTFQKRKVRDSGFGPIG